MATRLFSASKYGQQLFAQGGARRLTVSTMGESHGERSRLGAAIQYACWRHYHAGIVFDHRDYADGGSMHAAGGTTTTGPGGLTDQLVQFQARPTDIAFIASGYNDNPSTAATAASVAATVMGVADDVFTAGAKFVIICGMTPRSTSAAAFMAYNQHIRNYCAATQGALFLDVTSVLMDRQNSGALDMPYRDSGTYASGAYGSYTEDGTHWSGLAIRAIAPLIADIFRKIVGERAPRVCFNAGNYSPANSPYTNLLGDAGMCMGTQGIGTGGGFDTGVAGTGSSSRLWLSDTGDVTVTPSIVTGAGGERKQRLTLGGTAVDSASFLQLSCTPTITGADGGVSTRKLDFECLIELTGVTGLSDITLRPIAAANDSMNLNQADLACNRWPDDTTESLFAYTFYNLDVPSGNNPGFSVLLMFGAGATPAGTIDISRLSAMVVEG